MQPDKILQADLIDILFENRNKLYGAYQLRMQYPFRLKKGLWISVSVLASISILFTNRKDEGNFVIPINRSDSVYLQPVSPEMEIKKRESTATPTSNSIKDVIPLVVPEETNIEDTVPTENQRDQFGISTVTHKSDTLAENLNAPVNDGPHEDEEKSGHQFEEAKSYDWRTVDQASFPGGMDALKRFMQKHLNDPRNGNSDLETTSVQVLVRFVVSKDGCPAQFEVVSSGGKAFDEEVIRVLKKMPKWQPAFQNRKEVDIFFIMPVIFALEEN